MVSEWYIPYNEGDVEWSFSWSLNGLIEGI
jgi:hypothetical protein